MDDGGCVAWEVILVQQLAHFHFDQFQQLSVVDHVAFVQEHDDVRNTNLAGQEDVLTGLRHRAVSCGANQNCAVHLSRARDHVFHIVSVAWAINVGVVAIGSFVFDVRSVNRNTARFFFWCSVDLVVAFGGTAKLRC